MKIKLAFVKMMLVLMVIMSFGTSFVQADTVNTNDNKRTDEQFRGVWVASVLNINYPTVSTTNSALLKIEADNIIQSAQNAGFNAIFLQVRPCADSLYKSNIFPWSKYLTGQEGLEPNNDFDPLEYFIEQAHQRNIEVHAWINPYRITKKKSDDPAYTVDMLSAKHPARLHPEYVVSYGGNLYFDPALKQVRNLITDGVKEIIDNYDVDGIHFDDYFYPSKKFNDKKSYVRLGGGKPLDDWRRDNVNKLVRQVYNTVHASDKDIVFGISPFGIWTNDDSKVNGSKTKGDQSYSSHYADSLYWIDNSIIDYIAPQIYWHTGFEIADFKVLTDWWADAVSEKNVKLYIGLAAYKADNDKKDSPWYRNQELKNQLKYIKHKKNVDGFIAFSISSIRDSNRVYNAFRGAGNIKSVDDYSRPSIGLYGGSKNQYVGGLVYPHKPSYLNDVYIENISDKGFYGILVPSNEQKSFKVKNVGLSDTKIYQKIDSSKKNNKTNSKNKTNDFDYINKMLENEIWFAKINKEEVNLKADSEREHGSMELVPQNVMDEVESVVGEMVKLTSDRFVNIHDVDMIRKNNDVYKLNSARYIAGDDVDKIEFTSNIKPFIKTYLNGNDLVMELSGNVLMSDIYIPANDLVYSYTKENNDFRNKYVLHLKDINKIGGYYLEYKDDKIVFNIKHKKIIADSDKPLNGFTIVLDAGHGGKDNGALGLLGHAYAEKNVNLDITLKLRDKLKDLGATVILTRLDDRYVSLHTRLKFVYEFKPDMFISIHANSCGLHKDVNEIKGFSVYYSKDIAEEYSKLAQRQLCRNTACTNNKERTANFYVIRGTHCPSVLLETGFMPNPEDFDWLCDDIKQDEFVSELARTILLYFEK